MTTTEAITLDAKLKESNDKLYIAYIDHKAICWLESEYGDNSEEMASDGYYTREITACDLNSLLLEMFHGSAYMQQLAAQLQGQLNEYYTLKQEFKRK